MDFVINSPLLTVSSLPLDLVLDTILLAMTLAPLTMLTLCPEAVCSWRLNTRKHTHQT